MSGWIARRKGIVVTTATQWNAHAQSALVIELFSTNCHFNTKYVNLSYQLSQELAQSKARPVPSTDAWEYASAKLHQSATELLAKCEVGQPVYSPDGAGVVATIEEPAEGVREVIVTQDGLPFKREWHQGPIGGDSVRYEIYSSLDGNWSRPGHGFIDPVSRQIVQVG